MKTREFNKYLDNVLFEQVKRNIKEIISNNDIIEKSKEFSNIILYNR